MIRTALFALCMLVLATPSAAQVWPPRPATPLDDAARARADRERWRAGLDARQAGVAQRQLQTDVTLYDLETARQALEGPRPDPLPEEIFVPETLTASDADRQAARDAAQEALRRLDAMDAWFDRVRRQP